MEPVTLRLKLPNGVSGLACEPAEVNGKKVNIPSYALKVNDVVEVKDSNVSRQLATKSLEISTSRVVPDWLSLDKNTFKGTVMRVPTRDEIQPIANEQAVVEFYSR